MGIIWSLRAAGRIFPEDTIHHLTQAGPEYAYLLENRSFLASTDGQRYLQSDELRTTLAIQAGAEIEDVLEVAFAEFREQLVFRGTFPHPEFLRRLVKKFVASTTPRSLRRVLLISDDDVPEATSASFHLPQAYETSFPCSRCTVYRTENETYPMFVEVFHFANRNDPSVCATVSFRMAADEGINDLTTSDSRVEIYLTTSCRPQRAPFAQPSRKLFTQFDTFFGVLREVSPEGLEKMHAVSQGWRAAIDRHKRALSRRKLLVDINFYGEDPAVVTLVLTRWTGDYAQVLRVLVPHSLKQLSWMLREHLRDAHVKIAFYRSNELFLHPPQDATLRWDQPNTLGWAMRLFQSLRSTQVERVIVNSDLFGVGNLAALMMAARLSCRVGTFDMIQPSIETFEVREVVGLLRDPTAVASDKLVVRTRFLDAKDTTNVIREFYLILDDFEDAAFVDLPPTDRMKQLRHNRYGKEVTTRVHTYRNALTGEVLSAVRHSGTHHSRILFLKGRIALDDLRSKWTNDKY